MCLEIHRHVWRLTRVEKSCRVGGGRVKTRAASTRVPGASKWASLVLAATIWEKLPRPLPLRSERGALSAFKSGTLTAYILCAESPEAQNGRGAGGSGSDSRVWSGRTGRAGCTRRVSSSQRRPPHRRLPSQRLTADIPRALTYSRALWYIYNAGRSPVYWQRPSWVSGISGAPLPCVRYIGRVPPVCPSLG